MIEVAPLEFDKITGLVVKRHAAFAGSPEHESVILDAYSGTGFSWTVYVAVAPATATLWFAGVTCMLKSVISADTDVCASTIFPCASACTVPPLKNTGELPLVLAVGVAVIVTVAVDPDCSEIGPQLMLLFAEPAAPQVPELMLALTLVMGTPVTCELRLAVITIPFARSGPLFVTV